MYSTTHGMLHFQWLASITTQMQKTLDRTDELITSLLEMILQYIAFIEEVCYAIVLPYWA